MKKILLIICAIVFAIFVSLASLRLHKSANRPLLASLLTNEIKQDVKSKTKGMSETEIVNYAISRTAQEYKFSRKTNCMHYARLCSDICNYSFTFNGYKSKAHPVVGYVTCWGIDVCKLLYGITHDTFVKDHDFTEVNLQDRTIYVDASAYDLIYTKCWTE